MDLDRNTAPRNPFFNEGAMYVGKGKFLLPILSSSEEKKLTKKAKVIFGAVFAVFFVGIIVLACWLARPDVMLDDLPYLSSLEEVIGKSQMEVVEHLELADGLTQISSASYAIPGGCEYKGVEYSVVLHFEENEQLLCGYEYVAHYKADEKTAAKDILTAQKYFSASEKSRIEGEQLDVKKATLAQQLSGSDMFLQNSAWDISPERTWVTPLTEYLQYLENAEYWEGRVGEYLTKKACFYRDLDLGYNPQTQEVSIQLRFCVEADRSK